MPVHYVRREQLTDEVARLEAKGEVVTSTVAEGENFWVFTGGARRAAPGQPERRPA